MMNMFCRIFVRGRVLLMGGLIILLAALCFIFFFHIQVIRYTQARSLLGTFVTIHICANRHDRLIVLRAFDKAWNRLEEINLRMNVYNEESDIAKINRSYPNPVSVHHDVYELLALSLEYGKLTDGAFDITVRPLVVLWKEAEKRQQLPLPQEISEARQSMGADKIKLLSGDRVQLLNPQTRIDLSAIGQGYAADQAAKILQKEMLDRFLVDTGGEIFGCGMNEKNIPWHVGVRDPGQVQGMTDVAQIDQQGVSTSGDYEKYYLINQKRYSHIIDPRSGYPSDSVISATVIDKNATQADVFSTALCVLGQPGIRLLESLSPEIGILVVEGDSRHDLRRVQNAAYQRIVTRPGSF